MINQWWTFLCRAALPALVSLMAQGVWAQASATLKKGDLLKQPDLAKTLKLIRDGGPDAFYKGGLAQAIVDVQKRAATNGAAGTALTVGAAGTMALLTWRTTTWSCANRMPCVNPRWACLRAAAMEPPARTCRRRRW